MGRKNKPVERFVVMEFRVQIDAPVTIWERYLATLLYKSPKIAERLARAGCMGLPQQCSVNVLEVEK